MKKIFTSVLFLTFAAASVMAQENLLKNPTFNDGWNDKYDCPNNWSCYDGTFSVVEGTSADSYALQIVGDSKDGANVMQYVNGLSEGMVFTLSYDYKVTNAAKEDAYRHWFRWQRYVSSEDKNWVNPLDEDLLKMQDNGSWMENVSDWKHVSITVTAPATTTTLCYEFRVYGASTVQIANPMMVEGSGSGLSDAQAEKTGIYSANGNVYVLSNGVGMVEVYNLLGQLVRTEQVVDGCNELSGLNAGQVYVVRYGDKAQKVVL